MLKQLTTPPTNLGKRAEIAKDSRPLDRITGDAADLRTYESADKRQKYLRLWSFDGSTHSTGKETWYEVVQTPETPEPSSGSTKK